MSPDLFSLIYLICIIALKIIFKTVKKTIENENLMISTKLLYKL